MKTYTAAVAAEASGASASTLQRYANHHLRFQPCDGESRGSGDKRQYSTRRVIQTAIMVECSRLGISAARAERASFEFSDRGNSGRAVGELFPLGRTVLMGLADGQSKVINIPPDLTIADVLSSDGAAFIIDCGNVVAKVTKELNKL
jgi:hypothetical protein